MGKLTPHGEYKLKKGFTYTVIRGQRVRRYVFESRYFNKAFNQWHYQFTSLDGMEQYLPPIKGTKIIEL